MRIDHVTDTLRPPRGGFWHRHSCRLPSHTMNAIVRRLTDQLHSTYSIVGDILHQDVISNTTASTMPKLLCSSYLGGLLQWQMNLVQTSDAMSNIDLPVLLIAWCKPCQ